MIEHSDSEIEISVCPPPVFIPEGGNAAAQPDGDDESIVPLNAPDEGAPPNIPFVESDDAPAASDAASVADSYSSNEPDSEHLRQSKQIWERQSGHLCQTNKVTCTLDPGRFQFVPPSSLMCPVLRGQQF